jgi:RNA polymerase sigma-70 factor (ECF subfamily)
VRCNAAGQPCGTTSRRPTGRSGRRRSASPAEREILSSYIAAYEAGDDDATLALVAEDIRVTMPPAPFVFEGVAACYLQDPASREVRAFKIDVLRVVDGLIAEITTFGPRLLRAFDLPEVLR